MRMNAIAAGAAVLAAAAAVAGCGGGEQSRDEATHAATPRATTPANAREIRVELAEWKDSGMSGSATLREADEGVAVTAELEPEAAELPIVIFRGTCEKLGNDFYRLDDIVNGEREKLLAGVSIEKIQNEGGGSVAVAVLRNLIGLSGKAPKPVLACGVVPAG